MPDGKGNIMITCVIQYTLDPHAIEDFEKYAATWPPIIKRCGGELNGYARGVIRVRPPVASTVRTCRPDPARLPR